MKLIVNVKNDYKLIITKSYKLFTDLTSKKNILKKGKYKSELADYFNMLSKIKADKKINSNYIIIEKCFWKKRYNLENICLRDFVDNLEKRNINEFKTIYKNMFEN